MPTWRYDIVSIVEFPDDEAGVAALLQVGLPGAGGRGPYDPLDRVSLASSVERALLAEPLSMLRL